MLRHISAVGMAGIFLSSFAEGQVEIVLDPANNAVELREGDIQELHTHGIVFFTRMPNGDTAEGVWDINTDDETGDLRGMRVLDIPDFVTTESKDSFVLIRQKSRWENAKFPAGHAIMVPEAFISCELKKLELAWFSYDARHATIGTHPADDDETTLQAFTQTSDGKIRPGIWEENTTGEPLLRLVSVWPYAIKKLQDGSYEFTFGQIQRTMEHGDIPPEFINQNSRTLKLDVIIEGADGQDRNEDSIKMTTIKKKRAPSAPGARSHNSLGSRDQFSGDDGRQRGRRDPEGRPMPEPGRASG